MTAAEIEQRSSARTLAALYVEAMQARGDSYAIADHIWTFEARDPHERLVADAIRYALDNVRDRVFVGRVQALYERISSTRTR